MNHPTKKGEKFKGFGRTLTVKSFYGETGVFYDTYLLAKKGNVSKSIMVLNVESEGSTNLEHCFLIISKN